MKVTNLASEFLKFMVENYHDNFRKAFSFDQFKALHPDLNDSLISDALALLAKDGFVRVSSYNNIAAIVYLDVVAVQSVEEDTLLRKGYILVKELLSLL